MAITAATRTQLIGLSVAMLGQAPGTDRLNQWVADIDGDAMSVDDLANHIAESEAFQSEYPAFLTSMEFAEAFLGSVLPGLDEASMTEAVDIVSGMLDSGTSRGTLALAVVDFLHDVADKGMDHDSYESFGMSAMTMANKVEVASHYTLNARMMDPSSDVLANVTADAETAMDAINAIDNPPAPPMEPEMGQRFVLTPTIDDFTGGDLGDTFVAQPIQGADGLFNATLNSFDSIDGGGGSDTIHIFGVDPRDTLRLGAEDIMNVENVVISTVGGINADLTDWVGLEMVDLDRIGRDSDVTVIVDDGAMVSTDRTLSGDVTIVGSMGALDIEAGSGSAVKIGSAGQTGSVMVKGGASVTVDANTRGKQSESVTSVSVEGTKRAEGEETEVMDGYTVKQDVDGYVVGANGTTRITITVTVNGAEQYSGNIKLNKDGLITQADADLTPVTDADGHMLKFDGTGKIVKSGEEGGNPAGVTNSASAGRDPVTKTVNEGANTPTIMVLSNSIETITLTNTDAVARVKNDSKTEDGKKGTPEDLTVVVDGYGKHIPGAAAGKLCLDGAGNAENIMIDVMGDSDFRLATDKVKTLSISGDGDLGLSVTEFDPNDDGEDVPAASLESLTLAGSGNVTLGLAGLSGLTMIDASASSGANKLTMAPSADALTNLEMVTGGNGNDTVTLSTLTNGKLASIDTGDGNDKVTVNGMHSRDGIEVNLGAGNDSYSGTAGNTMSRINAGDGEDTLKLTSIANSTYKSDDDKQKSIYMGFETLDVGGSETGAYDMKLLGIVNDVLVSRSLKSGATVTLENMADGMGINVSGKSGSWPPFKPSQRTTATIEHELAERESGEPRSSGELEVSLNALGFANVKAQSGDLHGLGSSAMGEVDLTLTTGEDIEVLMVTTNARAHTNSTVTDPSGRMVTSDYVNKLTLDKAGTGTAVLEELIVDGNARLMVDTTNADAFAGLQLVDATDNSGGISFVGAAFNQELELLGSSGKDVLTIGIGGGEIYGGLGGDSLTGGDGRDFFIIDDASESQASVRGDGTLNLNGVDTITNFTPGDRTTGDRIDLSRGLLNAISGAIKDTDTEWDDWMTDSDGENAVTSIDNDAVDRANNDYAAANLESFIGNGNGLFESEHTLTSEQPGFSEVGDNTVTDKFSIAVIAQTDANDGMAGLWLLFDVDGDGDFDADNDMVIFLAGLTGTTEIDGDMFF